MLLEQEGRPREAVAAYRQALLVYDGYAPAAIHLTWLLATSDDPDLRDPGEAQELGQRIAKLSPSQPGVWISLAAAQAADGQFDKAIESAGEALKLARQAGSDSLVETVEGHIEHYRRGETAPAR
jgi:tetratricopeptide (TPR) repeat protein